MLLLPSNWWPLSYSPRLPPLLHLRELPNTAAAAPPSADGLKTLLSALPRPLRVQLGLPLAPPPSSSVPASPLFSLPAALAVALGGGLNGLVGERARGVLQVSQSALDGGAGGLPGALMAALCETDMHRLATVTASASLGGGAANATDAATGAAEVLSTSLHTLFLYLHLPLCGSGGDGGHGSSGGDEEGGQDGENDAVSHKNQLAHRLPSRLLELHQICLDKSAALLDTAAVAAAAPAAVFSTNAAVPRIGFCWSPTALLQAHGRVGRGTLSALASALGGALSADGCEGGFGGGAAVALMLLTARPLLHASQLASVPPALPPNPPSPALLAALLAIEDAAVDAEGGGARMTQQHSLPCCLLLGLRSQLAALAMAPLLAPIRSTAALYLLSLLLRLCCCPLVVHCAAMGGAMHTRLLQQPWICFPAPLSPLQCALSGGVWS